jgi:hypothetical protein
MDNIHTIDDNITEIARLHEKSLSGVGQDETKRILILKRINKKTGCPSKFNK